MNRHVITGHREAVVAVSTGFETCHDSIIAVNHLNTSEGIDSGISIRNSEVHRYIGFSATRSSNGTSVGTLGIDLRRDVVNRGSRGRISRCSGYNDVVNPSLGIDSCSSTGSSNGSGVVRIPSRSAIGAVLEGSIDFVGIDIVYQLVKIAADGHIITDNYG